MKIKKIYLSIIGGGVFFLLTPVCAKTLPQIVTELQGNPQIAVSTKLTEELSQKIPQNSDELYLLFDLVQKLQGQNREQVISCIARTEEPNLSSIFLKELKHSHPMIKAISAGMCGKLKIIAAQEPLKELIRQSPPIKDIPDQDEERALVTAILALGELKQDDSLDLLISLLGKTKSYEVQALRKFGAKPIPALIAKINAQETGTEARLAAIQVLMAVEDKAALPLLQAEASNSQSRTRPYAITTILKSAPKEYLPKFIRQWEKEPEVMLATRLLYYIDFQREKDQSLTPFLSKVLQTDYDAALRILAVNALARNADEAALNTLKQAAKDKNEKVSLYAKQALEMLAGK